MTRTHIALSLLALSMVGWSVSPVQAQPPKTATGTVTAIAADSVSVMVGANAMKFSVDGQTKVEASGAGTKTRQATAAGKAGPALSEVLKVGQRVTVSYQDMGGVLHASLIKASAPGGAGGGSTAGPKTLVSTGTVKSVAATSLSITGGSGGGATFDQTFTIDATTKVIGKGMTTVTKGQKNPITELIAAGDRVSVSYREVGGSLHATEIRATIVPR